MHKQGFNVISDDVVALNEQCQCLGGFPQIKLWEDSLDKLEIEKRGLDKVRLQINKYSLPITYKEEPKPLPIHAIYILTLANQNENERFDFFTLDGIEKFNALKTVTYRKGMIPGLKLQKEHMQLCAKIASSTPMSAITRPTSYFNAPQLANAVLEDLNKLGIDVSPFNCSEEALIQQAEDNG